MFSVRLICRVSTSELDTVKEKAFPLLPYTIFVHISNYFPGLKFHVAFLVLIFIAKVLFKRPYIYSYPLSRYLLSFVSFDELHCFLRPKSHHFMKPSTSHTISFPFVKSFPSRVCSSLQLSTSLLFNSLKEDNDEEEEEEEGEEGEGKEETYSPYQWAQFIAVSSHKFKGHGCDSQSGHMPRLQVLSHTVGACMRGN